MTDFSTPLVRAPGRTLPGTRTRLAVILASTMLLTACEDVNFSNLDFDLRGNAPGGLDTSGAARTATADRPRADRNGLITYPTYQVAVARRGDTVADLADRVGANPTELARFNGLDTGDRLRDGEVIAMPRRVAPGTPGATDDARPDIGAIAGAAIDRSAPGVRTIDVQTGQEPIRHRAARGETAFSIARLYGVSVKSLAEWNGLSSDLEVREGQFLIIPLLLDGTPADVAEGTAPPPSSSSALPAPVASATLPDSPNLDNSRVASTAPVPQTPAPAPVTRAPGSFAKPVGGTVSAYSSAKQGVDISANTGATVTAAAAGEVILITRDTDQNPVIVLSHGGDLKTVYANISNLTVEKGDRVSQGEAIASVGRAPSGLRFSVLDGFEPIDPTPLLR